MFHDNKRNVSKFCRTRASHGTSALISSKHLPSALRQQRPRRPQNRLQCVAQVFLSHCRLIQSLEARNDIVVRDLDSKVDDIRERELTNRAGRAIWGNCRRRKLQVGLGGLTS